MNLKGGLSTSSKGSVIANYLGSRTEPGSGSVVVSCHKSLSECIPGSEDSDVAITDNEVLLKISTTKGTELVQGTFKTTVDASGRIVYGSAREDHDNSDLTPILPESLATEDSIAKILELVLTSDSSKGNWTIEARDLERVNKVADYMRKQASTEDKAILDTKCPVLRISTNEADAQKFKKNLIKEKSDWEKSIRDVARSLQHKTMSKLLTEEKSLRDPGSKVVHRVKKATLSGVSRRISQLETAKNNMGKTVSANTVTAVRKRKSPPRENGAVSSGKGEKMKKKPSSTKKTVNGVKRTTVKAGNNEHSSLSMTVANASDDITSLKRKREEEKNSGCLQFFARSTPSSTSSSSSSGVGGVGVQFSDPSTASSSSLSSSSPYGDVELQAKGLGEN